MVELTKQDISKVYPRNLFTLQFGWNYEKVQSLGYVYVIMPALKCLYGGDPDKMKRTLRVYLTYFNIAPVMFHLITGTDMALGEEIGTEFEEVVIGIKTGLMEPLAGVGDTLFIAIYHVAVFSIAAYIALEGNSMRPPVPLITCAEALWVHYEFTAVGYNSGQKLATGFADGIAPITEVASILGLVVAGTLISSVIKHNTDLQSTFNEATFILQKMLDRILPCMLPLGIVMFSHRLPGRKKISSTKLIFVLIGLGTILGNLQSMLIFVVELFQTGRGL